MLRIRRLIKDDKGQITVFFAFIIIIYMILLGLAVDLGWIVYSQNKLQDSADLAVLSAAQYLPERVITGYNTLFAVFEENYGKSSPINNVGSFNGSRGIRIRCQDTVNLFFMPLFGIERTTIYAEAEAQIQPMSRAEAFVPIALFHTNFINYGHSTTFYAYIGDPLSGNFAVINPTGSDAMGDGELQSWIREDYKGESGMPAVGDNVTIVAAPSDTAVVNGFTERINAGNTIIICPVISRPSAGDSTHGQIMGYARLEVSSCSVMTIAGKKYLKLQGQYTEYIDSKSTGADSARYYGIKSVYLSK